MTKKNEPDTLFSLTRRLKKMVPECDRSPEMDELVCGLAIELMLRNGINGPNSDELRRRKNQEILRITNKIAQLKNIDRQPCGGA